MEEAGIALTQEFSEGEIPFRGRKSGTPDVSHQRDAWSAPHLCSRASSSLVCRGLCGYSDGCMGLEGMPLPAIPRRISVRDPLSSSWCYASHPLPTQNLKLKQNVMGENLAEKNVDDASSEPPTLSLETLQQSHPLF